MSLSLAVGDELGEHGTIELGVLANEAGGKNNGSESVGSFTQIPLPAGRRYRRVRWTPPPDI
jgi:hypothetical protein